IADFEGFAVIASSLAFFAGYIDVRQKIHFNDLHTPALTGFTATAFDIERKTAGFISPDLCLRYLGKQQPDIGKKAAVGSRVATRRPPDRTLIDLDHFIDMLQA